jgi:para-aminobenzoate synthetase component I
MRKVLNVSVPLDGLKNRLYNRFRDETFCLLNSNGFAGKYEFIAGAGIIDQIVTTENSIDSLHSFHLQKKDWLLGFLSYDIKNEIEELSSNRSDGLKFPKLHFFQPELLFIYQNHELQVHYHDSEKTIKKLNDFLEFLAEIGSHNIAPPHKHLIISKKISQKTYINKVNDIIGHLKRGDIYEINFCQEFYCNNAYINPWEVYQKLNKISPMPFSAYYQHDKKSLMCASPERFLQKTGSKVISQPIKGTISRGLNEEDDWLQMQNLKNNAKEISENVMIVDLVRNDLSRIASKESVRVEELFGLYTFSHVHQMISTVSAEIESDFTFSDVIKATFPMGSMTGAPKISAMELIEKYEESKRGLFSGSVGYITPEGDFDLNVIIRSVFYNDVEKYLSFSAGSAITVYCDPEKEYEECLLKTKAIMEALGAEFNEL